MAQNDNQFNKHHVLHYNKLQNIINVIYPYYMNIQYIYTKRAYNKMKYVKK